jgi:hypothetical protein
VTLALEIEHEGAWWPVGVEIPNLRPTIDGTGTLTFGIPLVFTRPDDDPYPANNPASIAMWSAEEILFVRESIGVLGRGESYTIDPTPDRNVADEANALVDLARSLTPPDTLDLSDRTWTIDEMVTLRNRLGSMRKAIDKVNLAIADRFAESVPVGYSTVVEGGFVARVTETTRKPFWIDGSGLAFVEWLRLQPADIVAGFVSTTDRDGGTRRPRLAGLPQVAQDTFIDWDESTANPSLAVFPIGQAKAKWLTRLNVGDVARWDHGRIDYIEEGGGGDDGDV